MHRGRAGGRTRLGSALVAAGLTNGPAELLDFIVPLWLGIALDATPSQVGFLVSLELIASVIARPVAGLLADSRERTTLAGVGALLYGLSCCGYASADALTGSLPTAYAAAALGGIGGALLWVSLRAMIGEHLAADPGVFARLMSVQETGAWVAFVTGLLLLGHVDSYATVLLVCAAACAVGAVVLFLGPTSIPPESDPHRRGGDRVSAAPRRTRGIAQALRPMLIATVVTALAETMIGILLLLHLQRDLGLGVIEIAYVFLPGAIALGVLPPVLHTVVLRIGRRAAMAAGSVLSGLFALSLAYTGGPVVIAALWILCGVAWAMVIPIEQAVVTERHPDQVGAALGIYTAATLIGGAVGASVAGVLYDATSWQGACLVAGTIILSGAAIGPWALTRLGPTDTPARATVESADSP
ncbi:MFS transporter [Arthrobacter sp. L77]|uniref:MFS transporter n=1 Tax=Arthrobacter sp. L77 TaxID=1496689 RepID=UPI0009E5728F|nr:MFS transporter [Arthrobacter sp. L77]